MGGDPEETVFGWDLLCSEKWLMRTAKKGLELDTRSANMRFSVDSEAADATGPSARTHLPISTKENDAI